MPWNSEEDRVIFHFSEDYRKFLSKVKTEREFVKEGVLWAEQNGFIAAHKLEKYSLGDKIYYVNRNKNLVLAIIGQEDMEQGIHYVVSHIDSPRLDLKANPLYEDLNMAFMKTHYYGGIKKYQWAAIPLAMHGIVILEDGEEVEIVLGEKEDEPVFTVPDLLPHLMRKAQGERKAGEVLQGEELQILVGSIPTRIVDEKVKDSIKKNILDILKRNYGIEEEDFVSAELELVPAGAARDVGFDKSFIGAYGQDDRVCAYTSMRALLELTAIPKRTVVCFLADKEEIGSTGSTGLASDYFNYVTGDLLEKAKGNFNEMMLRRTLWNSKALSSDVNVAMDPIFKGVHDAQNAAKVGGGVVLTKYTGSGGKYHTNDADAEYVAYVRRLLNEGGVSWQTGMLGKVDEGGGGTVAMFLAHLGIHTIDIGPGLLSMHSPFELASKWDIYHTYKAYKVFYQAK